MPLGRAGRKTATARHATCEPVGQFLKRRLGRRRRFRLDVSSSRERNCVPPRSRFISVSISSQGSGSGTRGIARPVISSMIGPRGLFFHQRRRLAAKVAAHYQRRARRRIGMGVGAAHERRQLQHRARPPSVSVPASASAGCFPPPAEKSCEFRCHKAHVRFLCSASCARAFPRGKEGRSPGAGRARQSGKAQTRRLAEWRRGGSDERRKTGRLARPFQQIDRKQRPGHASTHGGGRNEDDMGITALHGFAVQCVSGRGCPWFVPVQAEYGKQVDNARR
jgi:hypothetical protein